MNLLLSSLIFIKLCLCLLLFFICEMEFSKMKRRAELMICLKEVKGETHQFIEMIEKVNWGIRNADKAKYLAIFIPALIPVAANSEKAKKVMIHYQNMLLPKYILKISSLISKCKISSQTMLTPYQIHTNGFKRNFEGVTIWRKKWKIKISSKEELMTVELTPLRVRSLKPQIQYKYLIREEKLWSAFPFS